MTTARRHKTCALDLFPRATNPGASARLWSAGALHLADGGPAGGTRDKQIAGPFQDVGNRAFLYPPSSGAWGSSSKPRASCHDRQVAIFKTFSDTELALVVLLAIPTGFVLGAVLYVLFMALSVPG